MCRDAQVLAQFIGLSHQFADSFQRMIAVLSNQFAVNINLRANKYLSLTGLRRHNAIDEISEPLAS